MAGKCVYQKQTTLDAGHIRSSADYFLVRRSESEWGWRQGRISWYPWFCGASRPPHTVFPASTLQGTTRASWLGVMMARSVCGNATQPPCRLLRAACCWDTPLLSSVSQGIHCFTLLTYQPTTQSRCDPVMQKTCAWRTLHNPVHSTVSVVSEKWCSDICSYVVMWSVCVVVHITSTTSASLVSQ